MTIERERARERARERESEHETARQIGSEHYKARHSKDIENRPGQEPGRVDVVQSGSMVMVVVRLCL